MPMMSQPQPAAAEPVIDATREANLWFALTRAFSPPSSWPQDLPELLRAAFSDLSAEAACAAEACAAAVEECADPLVPARAHAALFVGPFAVAAPPWASFYLDPEQRLMGPVANAAAEAYAEAGLAMTGAQAEPPDHITHALEFMYYLAFREATLGDPVWRERRARFWRGHLGRWLPLLVAAMEKGVGDSDFYRSLVALSRAVAAATDATLGAAERAQA